MRIDVFFPFFFLLFSFLVFTAWHDKSGALHVRQNTAQLFTRQDFKTICVHKFHILWAMLFTFRMPIDDATKKFCVALPFFERFQNLFSKSYHEHYKQHVSIRISLFELDFGWISFWLGLKRKGNFRIKLRSSGIRLYLTIICELKYQMSHRHFKL